MKIDETAGLVTRWFVSAATLGAPMILFIGTYAATRCGPRGAIIFYALWFLIQENVVFAGLIAFGFLVVTLLLRNLLFAAIQSRRRYVAIAYVACVLLGVITGRLDVSSCEL